MKKRRGLILSQINEITEGTMRERRMTLCRFPLHFYITDAFILAHPQTHLFQYLQQIGGTGWEQKSLKTSSQFTLVP